MMKLTTWNVNGIRAAMEKGLREYLRHGDADVICLQETKAQPDQCDLGWLEGYQAVWNSAVKKGYSGTLVLTRRPFVQHSIGLGIAEHDTEGGHEDQVAVGERRTIHAGRQGQRCRQRDCAAHAAPADDRRAAG